MWETAGPFRLQDFNVKQYGDGTQVYQEEILIQGGRYIGLDKKVIFAHAFDPRFKFLQSVPVGDNAQVWAGLLNEMIKIAKND